MSWHVYLLTCADGTLYCGVTSDLARRLAEHNGGPSGAGAKYTRARRPVALAAHAPCADKSAALRLELAVKKRPRAGKLDYLLAQPDAIAGGPSAEKRPAEPLQTVANAAANAVANAASQAPDALASDKADIRAAALAAEGAT